MVLAFWAISWARGWLAARPCRISMGCVIGHVGPLRFDSDQYICIPPPLPPMSLDTFPNELCSKIARYTASDDDIQDDLFLSSLGAPAIANAHHPIEPLASASSAFTSICRPILFSHIWILSVYSGKSALETLARIVVARPHVSHLIK